MKKMEKELMVFLGLAIFLGTFQANKAVDALSHTANTNKEVVESLNSILVNTDRICTGSGIKGVG